MTDKITERAEIREALKFAKPGRLLPLDEDGNMSAEGVQEVIHAVNVLAAALREAQAALEVIEKELAQAKEELESIAPDVLGERTISQAIEAHRKWAEATEGAIRMALEERDKAKAELREARAKAYLRAAEIAQNYKWAGNGPVNQQISEALFVKARAARDGE